MKILYAIQGTGNGHLARAIELVPILQEMAEVDVLVSGIQADIKLPFEIKYHLFGVSFIFGKHGGVDIFKTLYKLRPLRFLKDLIKLPVQNYDAVLCDFEPVTAWSCLLKNKKSIGISHQNAVLHKHAPHPEKQDWAGECILRYYAPCDKNYGFHFKSLDTNIFTPIIRESIRNAIPTNKKHYTVYLPSYSNAEIEKTLAVFKDFKWEVFSKNIQTAYQSKNILFQPISLDNFNRSFINCEGILCNAGFETPAEALHMGKKLCVIPMKYQYEQACNAEFLSQLGVLSLPSLSNQKSALKNWLNNSNSLQIEYPDNSAQILCKILSQCKYSDNIKPLYFPRFAKYINKIPMGI